MAEVPNPLDTALDLFLYAPVGLMMTAAEELPKMAAKGRTRINTQLMMARVVGQFAVSKGRQELEKRFAPSPPPPEPAPRPERPASFDEMTSGPGHTNGKAEPVVTRPAGPPAEGLAIPGYDSLSASQVVQRLAGLSRDELAAVAAYEQAHRGRRTILNRIAQLQGA